MDSIREKMGMGEVIFRESWFEGILRHPFEPPEEDHDHHPDSTTTTANQQEDRHNQDQDQGTDEITGINVAALAILPPEHQAYALLFPTATEDELVIFRDTIFADVAAAEREALNDEQNSL